MWKLTGFVLIIAGSSGMAWSICRQNKSRLELLKQMRDIYENMQYYISYQKAAIPEVLWQLVQRTGTPFSQAFANISTQVQEEGADFGNIWRKQMTNVLSETALKEQDRKLLIGFPSYLGFMEEGAQAAALDEPLRELERRIGDMEKEQRDKNRVIMSLGIAGGFLLSILLL